MTMAGCNKNEYQLPHNSIYYWRTNFNLGNYEKDFLEHHNIERVYLRFFDVDINENNNFSDKCAPVASVNLNTSKNNLNCIKRRNVVPVVFITTEAIREYRTFIDDLAHRLFAMCSKHEIVIDEVQFDCDWTSSTRNDYYMFLKEERNALKKYFEKDIMLSSTIRLHQLAQTPPDVDRGVLMCYNTGNFKEFTTHNSILDIEDIKPYLKYLKSYELPLTLALPTYSWYVEFDENRDFVKLNRTDYDDRELKIIGDNVYEVEQTFQGQKTKYVRYEQVSSETILQAKRLIEGECGSLPIVLYHLDSTKLSKYTEYEINSFFN